MKLDPIIGAILEKASVGQVISRGEALTLMKIDLLSPEMYALCGVANQLSRQHFHNLGEIYAQIGLDFAPCPGNCEFCSFGAEHGIVESVIEYPDEGIARAAKICEDRGANGIYLMTTARYRFQKFLKVAQAVRQSISPDLPLVANIGDFNESQARDLADLGFKAIYHAVRLNEGKGTALPVSRRTRTIEAARKAGLALHFCVEPVGPEHTPEAQVDLMFLGRDLGVTFSGAMRRVCVPGTRAAERGQITWWNLARTVAVCRLVMGDTVLGHCTHEPNLPALLAGANLLWAEIGPNPRDDQPDTENSRGMGVKQCQELLTEAGWEIRRGPAITAVSTLDRSRVPA
jgi:biotin synthase